MDLERYKALKDEVEKLQEINFIKESFYPNYLANLILVKKPNGKWHTYIDFTDLNKACPKDNFSLPLIDQLVDATLGYELLSFMDTYSDYISFITDRELYCYKVMPFRLKNTGTTYQRLVNIMFKDQIGKTMEVYLDDMLVKSKVSSHHIVHLMEMFELFWKY